MLTITWVVKFDSRVAEIRFPAKREFFLRKFHSSRECYSAAGVVSLSSIEISIFMSKSVAADENDNDDP